jgi:hypothetical protein
MAIATVLALLASLVVLSRILPPAPDAAAKALSKDMVAQIAMLQQELGSSNEEKEKLVEQVKEQDKSMRESRFIRRVNLDASPVHSILDTPRSTRSEVRMPFDHNVMCSYDRGCMEMDQI